MSINNGREKSGRAVSLAVACGIGWSACCAVPAFAQAQAKVPATPAVPAAKKKEQKSEYKFVYDAKNKRNPFSPLVSPDGRFVNLEPPERKSDLTLEGIIYDAHGISCAVVNGAVVKVGDDIDGFQVLRIEQNKVTFIKNGQTNEVVLKKEE